MKRISIGLLALGLLAQPAMAQHSKVTSAWSYMNSKDYEKARDAINEAVQNEDTKNDPKTWKYRGEAYQGLYETALSKKQPGNIADAHEAVISYKKCIELDTKNRYTEVKDRSHLLGLTFDMLNAGINSYNSRDYKIALSAFDDFYTAYNALGDAKKSVDASLKESKIDPRDMKLYMAGCAMNLNDTTKAEQYLTELADQKYDNPAVYSQLATMYTKRGQQDKAMQVLDKGLANVADSAKGTMLIDKLNILIGQNKTTEALELGKEAIAHDPKNVSLYLAMGTMYESKGMTKEADDIYKKALAINPEDFSTNAQIGLNLFNQGADRYNESIQSNVMSVQDKKLNEAKDIWRNAIPSLEKAASLKNDKTDKKMLREVYNSLGEIYYKLGDMTNGKKYKDLAKSKL
jgi:tetratricopeptide (TPR) repeat protein